MVRASLHVREIARQVIASDASSFGTKGPAAFEAIERIAQRLSDPMGPGSFQALLTRALARSIAEVPWLAELRATETGQMDGLTGAIATRSAEHIAEAEVVLLAHLLELLVIFIGPSLTLRFFRQAWPQITFDFSDFGNANDD